MALNSAGGRRLEAAAFLTSCHACHTNLPHNVHSILGDSRFRIICAWPGTGARCSARRHCHWLGGSMGGSDDDAVDGRPTAGGAIGMAIGLQPYAYTSSYLKYYLFLKETVRPYFLGWVL